MLVILKDNFRLNIRPYLPWYNLKKEKFYTNYRPFKLKIIYIQKLHHNGHQNEIIMEHSINEYNNP